ncbi:hydrogenase maturation protease [Zavarzinia compransoris]|uniref:Hydrogenase maturation protease n=1 Tax=Zavarzinia compransoris TaxID=1264899 RepID=A0A317ED25_9PROT|nr:hydrogenase maturation protease [Zavarzinia compransoris]PWR23115.1 hydrogenase maturation protease [Zavarzinia compransoris]TDP46333.1 hydrogenase maturation protease [Zavarzinia compransoris]
MVLPAVADLSPVTAAVIGCGNPNRRDDGAGPAVIARLRQAGVGGAGLFDAGTDGMAVLYAARGCRRLIIVDAARTGAVPGAIYEVPGEILAAPHRPGMTLHDFRWDHALHAGRRIYGDQFPGEVTVLLIEAGDLDFGLGLTPPVATAVEAVATRIARLLEPAP